jgi:hypothetical protein
MTTLLDQGLSRSARSTTISCGFRADIRPPPLFQKPKSQDVQPITIERENDFLWDLASSGAHMSFSTTEGCCVVSPQMCAFLLPPEPPQSSKITLPHWTASVAGGEWCSGLKKSSVLVSPFEKSEILIEYARNRRMRVKVRPFTQTFSPRSLLGNLAERFFRWEVGSIKASRDLSADYSFSPTRPVVLAELSLSEAGCRLSGDFFSIEGKVRKSPFSIRLPLALSWAEFSTIWNFLSAGGFAVAGTSPKMPYCFLRPGSGLAFIPRPTQ